VIERSWAASLGFLGEGSSSSHGKDELPGGVVRLSLKTTGSNGASRAPWWSPSFTSFYGSSGGGKDKVLRRRRRHHMAAELPRRR